MCDHLQSLCDSSSSFPPAEIIQHIYTYSGCKPQIQCKALPKEDIDNYNNAKIFLSIPVVALLQFCEHSLQSLLQCQKAVLRQTCRDGYTRAPGNLLGSKADSCNNKTICSKSVFLCFILIPGLQKVLNIYFQNV